MANVTILKPAGVTVRTFDAQPPAQPAGLLSTVDVYAPGLTVAVFDHATVPLAPTISGFAATPNSITVGQSTTLNATVTNALLLQLDGAPIAGLPITVAPSVTRTYTLTVTGAAGTTTATAQTSVLVSAALPGIALGDTIEVTVASGIRAAPGLTQPQLPGGNEPIGSRATVLTISPVVDAETWYDGVWSATGRRGYIRGSRVVEVAGTPQPPTGETITVNVAAKLQKIKGWEAHARAWQVNKLADNYDPSWQANAPAVAAFMVNVIGINRIQVPLRTGWLNPVDYWSQFVAGTLTYTQWKTHNYEKIGTAIYWSEFDFLCDTVVLPMAAVLTARGETLYVNLGVVDFNTAGFLQGTVSLATDSNAYANFVLACFNRLKTRCGIMANALELCNEPENTAWSGTQIGNGLVAAKAKLEAAGYPGLKYIGPSHSSSSRTFATADAMLSVPGASAALTTIAFHRYDSPTAATIAQLDAYAKSKGKALDMSEWIDATADKLIEDVGIGNCESWQKWAIADRKEAGRTNPQAFYCLCDTSLTPPAISLAPNTPKMVAIMRYVRMNADRVTATASNSARTALAFQNANGSQVVVVRSTAAAAVTVSGLTPGLYGIDRVAANDAASSLPDATVAADGLMPVTLIDGLTTIYGKAGAIVPPVPIDPPVVTPPGGPAPPVQSRAMNLSKLVVFKEWNDFDRYERYQKLVILKSATESIKFQGFTSGGSFRPLDAVSYSLKVGASVKATIAVAPGTMKAEFPLDTTGLAPGWNMLDTVAPASETAAPMWVYVMRGAVGPPTTMPVATGSYDVLHEGLPYMWAIVPATYAPTPKPLAPRVATEFSDATHRSSLFRRNLIPGSQVRSASDIHRPNRDPNGIVSTMNMQAYFWSSAVNKHPRQNLLDGPRNVGTVVMPTHIIPGHNGGVWLLDPWRFLHISADGTVTTLVGYRHNPIAGQWQSPDKGLELVGDWSAVPATRHGLHEAWGASFDQASLAIDPNAPPVMGLQPHLVGPRLFISDPQNNRVLLCTFSKNSFTAPAVVTEFLTGLADPWDVVCEAGVLYVSERFLHRIVAYDATTGAFIRIVTQGNGAPLAYVNASRFVVKLAPLAAIQAQPCVLPEGLAIQDGLLYFGSAAMEQVIAISLASGVRAVACAPKIDDNSHFVKIAISDGTFGPRGTIFSSTWSIGNFGMPEAFLPGGVRWNYNEHEYIGSGRGKWGTLGYSSACGVGRGRLLCGSSQEGLIEVTKALPTDPTPDYAKYMAGHNEYLQMGGELLHGPLGYGPFGFALPFGKSANIDYYLRHEGH